MSRISLYTLVFSMSFSLSGFAQASSQEAMNDSCREEGWFDSPEYIDDLQTDVKAPIAHATWTHGHSMQIEYPGKIQSTWRAGFFIRVVGKPNTTNWFHFAIPTPVIVNGKRLSVGSCMLRFKTGGLQAVVRDVHVFDGEKKIVQHNDVNLTGNHGFERFNVPNNPDVHWGLGISIGVTFLNGTNAQRTIEMISAGCDLFE